MQFYGLVFFRKALAGSKFISKGKAEMDRRILEAFEDCPVVAAIKDDWDQISPLCLYFMEISAISVIL